MMEPVLIKTLCLALVRLLENLRKLVLAILCCVSNQQKQVKDFKPRPPRLLMLCLSSISTPRVDYEAFNCICERYSKGNYIKICW